MKALVRRLSLAGIIACLIPQVSFATTCETTSPNPNAAPETNQFAFLIGTHDVTLHAWTGTAWTPPRPAKALWKGWYGLDGLAIYDEWHDPEQQNHGVNVRFYDVEDAAWKMMWISNTGRQVQDLRANFIDGKLTMWQVYPPRPGWKAEFSLINADQWSRSTYTQDSEGTWQPQFKLVATRIGCPPTT